MTFTKRLIHTRTLPDEVAARSLAALHRAALSNNLKAVIMAEIKERKLYKYLCLVNGCLIPLDDA